MNIPIANRALRLRVLRKYNAKKVPDNSFASSMINYPLMARVCLEEALKLAQKYKAKND